MVARPLGHASTSADPPCRHEDAVESRAGICDVRVPASQPTPPRAPCLARPPALRAPCARGRSRRRRSHVLLHRPWLRCDHDRRPSRERQTPEGALPGSGRAAPRSRPTGDETDSRVDHLLFGLLYHLAHPEAAIAYLAACTQDFLLLETCVSYGKDDAVNLVAETAASPSQAIAGTGCRPTRQWIWTRLSEHFPHVYATATQPWHRAVSTGLGCSAVIWGTDAGGLRRVPRSARKQRWSVKLPHRQRRH